MKNPTTDSDSPRLVKNVWACEKSVVVVQSFNKYVKLSSTQPEVSVNQYFDKTSKFSLSF